MKTLINSHKSILCLNSPFSKTLLKGINTNVPVIGADGGGKQALAVGLHPYYIIGDQDSMYDHPDCKVIKAPDPDFTDFEKSLFFIKKENLFPTLIFGVNNGEIDHIIGNMQIILKYAYDIPLYFLDSYSKEEQVLGNKIGIPVIGKPLNITLPIGTCLSILFFNDTIIETNGLKWELKKKTLSINGCLSLRNETIAPMTFFNVTQGKALIIFDI